MSVKSEVRVCTTKEGFETMKAYVKETIANTKEKKVFNLLDSIDEKVDLKNDFIVFGWKSTKWYTGLYSDVDIVMESLDKLFELNIPYQFIRVGEEIGDVEELYNIENDYFPWMSIDTTISYDY